MLFSRFSWTRIYLQCSYLSHVIPTGNCRPTCIVHWYDMPTNITIRYDMLVLLNFYMYDVAIPNRRFHEHISQKWHRSKIKTPCVICSTTLLTPWLASFSVHSKCLKTIFWFFVRGADICSKYYIIMATFCWHIIITSDYKLMCPCVQVMEDCILFNVGFLFDDSSV